MRTPHPDARPPLPTAEPDEVRDTPSDDEARTALLERNRWVGLAIILVGPFLGVLDFFIANIGVPSIRTSLHASFSQVELVIAGYGLAYAVWLITGGRLGDIFGRRRVFLVGLLCFTASSVFCGLAPNAPVLIAARLLQGSAAALMFPQALSFIQVHFAGAAKRVAFSLFGAMIGFGSITGQIAGGLLIQANLWHLGWRPIFLINLPIGLLTLAAAWLFLSETKASHAPRLDPGGMVLVTAATFLFSLPLVEGREQGWPLWAWVALFSSLPLFWLFYRYELRQAARSKSPLVEPRLFRDRGFIIGLIVTCIYYAGHSSMLLITSLYLQLGLQLNPMQAGLALVPFSTGFLLGSAFSGKLNGLLGRSSLHLGTLILGLSTLGLLFVAKANQGHDSWSFEITFFIYGIGRGFTTAPLYNTVLSGVPVQDAGAAAGVASTMQQLANSLGLAMIGAVVFAVIPRVATPVDYTRGFVASSAINLVLLAFAALLLCFIPHDRVRGGRTRAA